MVVRREIRSAVERLPVRRKKCSQRPPALSTDRTHRNLVAAVNVRPLVAIYFDGNKIFVHNARHFRIIVRLPIHHVTPMAPHRPNIEQDGLVLPRCRGESLLRPLIPANGLVHCGPQVSGGRLGQGVQRLGSHDLTSLSGFRSMWGDGSTK